MKMLSTETSTSVSCKSKVDTERIVKKHSSNGLAKPKSVNSDKQARSTPQSKGESQANMETQPLTLENVLIHTMMTGGQDKSLYKHTTVVSPNNSSPAKRQRTRRRGSKANTLVSKASYAIQETDSSDKQKQSDCNHGKKSAKTMDIESGNIGCKTPKQNESEKGSTVANGKEQTAPRRSQSENKKSNFFSRNSIFRRSKSVDAKRNNSEPSSKSTSKLKSDSRRNSVATPGSIAKDEELKSPNSKDMLCHSTPNVMGEKTNTNSLKHKPKSVSRNLFGKDSIFKRSKSTDSKSRTENKENQSNNTLESEENQSNNTLEESASKSNEKELRKSNEILNNDAVVETSKSDRSNVTLDKSLNNSSDEKREDRPELVKRSQSTKDTKLHKSPTDPDFIRNTGYMRSKSSEHRRERRASEIINTDGLTGGILSEEKKGRPQRKRERSSQQQRSFRIKKSDHRRKSADFSSFVQQRQMIEKPPDPGYKYPESSDVKMLSKASRVLQEHVSDKNKTNLACIPSGKPTSIYKENVVIPNYNTNEQYIFDRISGITYVRGRLLGKGGFAKCYEMIDTKTHKTYAGKIISKSRLTKPHQRDKIAREIELHKPLRHKNVVGFHSYFEDEHNVYIILELCSRKSLVHVLKQRKTLTEPEVRFYLAQLVSGTRYIHNQHIVHRDLKLGNMLLNESMSAKIADFGLATRVEYEGEKKMTVCGTPNYIAPEVLQKKGHSYEADIWAMGCVMYAMLVGRPPFETSTLKETYMRITSNKYFVPPNVSKSAKHLIQKLLHPDPELRPTLDKIIQDDFFSAGIMPKLLPTSCCDSAPKWPSSSHGSQRPKSYAAPVSPSEAMHKITSSLANWKGSKKSASQIITRAKDDIQVTPSRERGEGRNEQEKSQQSVTSESRKSSRDRSPHHTNNSRSRSAGGDSRRHADRGGGGGRNTPDERSRSPPKSPRQVVIETKPLHHTPKSLSTKSVNSGTNTTNAVSEANNNVINSQHLNGYHPGMVLCSPAPAHHGSQRSTFSATGSAAPAPSAGNTHVSNPQLAKSPSRTSVAAPPPPQHINSVTDIKALPAGSAIRLYQMLSTCLEQMPQDSKPTPVQSAKPLWVTKWVDYSNKYGFGFQLSDKGVGVLFNDTTRMLLASDGRTVQYNDLSNRVFTFTTDTTPSEHQKKSTLLLYFAQYMGEHLIHGGDLLHHQGGGGGGGGAAAVVAQVPGPSAIFMKKWFRTSKAIVMYLNNGTLQVNFFDDHTKVILSPEGQDYLVTYINSSRQSISYRLLQFRHFGCSDDIAERLSYARKMLESIINIEGETV